MWRERELAKTPDARTDRQSSYQIPGHSADIESESLAQKTIKIRQTQCQHYAAALEVLLYAVLLSFHLMVHSVCVVVGS